MRYELVTAESFDSFKAAEELNKRVNQKLEEGWELYGNPIPSERGNGINSKIIVVQAMTKK